MGSEICKRDRVVSLMKAEISSVKCKLDGSAYKLEDLGKKFEIKLREEKELHKHLLEIESSNKELEKLIIQKEENYQSKKKIVEKTNAQLSMVSIELDQLKQAHVEVKQLLELSNKEHQSDLNAIQNKLDEVVQSVSMET